MTSVWNVEEACKGAHNFDFKETGPLMPIDTVSRAFCSRVYVSYMPKSEGMANASHEAEFCNAAYLMSDESIQVLQRCS